MTAVRLTKVSSRSDRFRQQSAKILSKHGLIISCILDIAGSRLTTEEAENVFQLVKALEGKRYGFADDVPDVSTTSEAALNVSSWLKTVMS